MSDIPPLRRPEPARLFAARAARLEALADGHAAAPFVLLLARLARGQEAAVRELRPAPSARAGARPLDAGPPDGAWRAMLRVVLGAVRGAALPPPAREAVARLEAAGEAELEALAAAVVAGPSGRAGGWDAPAAPFVGAALQAWYAARAAALSDDALELAAREADGPGCPLCGFAPVAATVRGDDRLRYVACGLCAAEWHVPRVQCAICRTTKGIGYYEVDGGDGAVKAESCASCRAYLKVVDLLAAPAAEPVADDAATLVLDLLLGEEGWRRAGRNLLAPAGEPA